MLLAQSASEAFPRLTDLYSDVSCAALLRFAIGQQATGWCSQGCQAIVDTGTFLLTIPQQYMGSFLEAVGAQESNGEVGATGALLRR